MMVDRARPGGVSLRPDIDRRSPATASGPRQAAGLSRSRGPLLADDGADRRRLLAVPVVLTMQFLATSTRPSFGFGVAAMGSLPPESLATILFGNVFGSLRSTYDYWGPDWHSPGRGHLDRPGDQLPVRRHDPGPAAALARDCRRTAACPRVPLLPRRRRGRDPLCARPLYAGLRGDLRPPAGVDLYRRPADATFLINIVLAFAAGYLVHRYVRDGLPRFDAGAMGRFRVALPMLAVGLVIAAIASAMVFALRAGQSAAAMREIGVALSCRDRLRCSPQPAANAAPAAGRGTRDDRAHGRRIGRPPCGLAAERGAGGALCGVPGTCRRAIAGAADPQARTRRAAMPSAIIRAWKFSASAARGRTPPWCCRSRTSSATIRCGWPITSGPSDPARTPRTRTCAPSRRHSAATSAGSPDLLGLEYLVLDRPIERMPRHFPRLKGAEVVYGTGKMWVYRLNVSSPRTYLAHHVTPVESEAVLDQEELPEFNRETEALIDERSIDLLKAQYSAAPTTPSPVPSGVAGRSPHRRLSSQCGVDRGRELVGGRSGAARRLLSRMGGDGRRAAPAAASRQSAVPRRRGRRPGKHRVEFEFRPISLDNLVAAATELVSARDRADQDRRTFRNSAD